MSSPLCSFAMILESYRLVVIALALQVQKLVVEEYSDGWTVSHCATCACHPPSAEGVANRLKEPYEVREVVSMMRNGSFPMQLWAITL
jgi:hypothetical protein